MIANLIKVMVLDILLILFAFCCCFFVSVVLLSMFCSCHLFRCCAAVKAVQPLLLDLTCTFSQAPPEQWFPLNLGQASSFLVAITDLLTITITISNLLNQEKLGGVGPCATVGWRPNSMSDAPAHTSYLLQNIPYHTSYLLRTSLLLIRFPNCIVEVGDPD